MKLRDEIFSMAVVICMFVVAGIVYDRLPQQLPVHWNTRGDIDDYMTKSPISSLLFPLVALGTWLLFLVLPHFDPNKKNYPIFRVEYLAIERSILLFFLYVYLITLGSTLGLGISISKALPFGIGLFLIAIGNPLGKIRFNYFVGIKLPWTLANEKVWNKTHRLGGKLFVVSGLLTMASVLIAPAVSFWVLLISSGIGILTCAVYSFLVHRGLTKSI